MVELDTAVRKERRGNNIEYVFLCPDCGKEITRRLDFLKANDAPGKCLTCANKDNWWKTQLRPYEYILSNIRCQYRRRDDVIIALTYEDILFFVGQKVCCYCERPLVWLERQTKKSGSTNLDRKDSRLGYTRENCVPCCWECNRIKGNVYTFEEMKIIGAFFKSFRVSATHE